MLNFRHLLFSAMLIAGISSIGCGSSNIPKTADSAGSAANKDSGAAPKKDSVVTVNADTLSDFHNMEFVEYCVGVPLNDYAHNDKASDVKARHVFTSKTNTDDEITVQGMMRSETTVTLSDYFANSYTNDDEAEGKIVQEKKLLGTQHCFYAKGYWSNEIYKSRFLEITWLRTDEVISYKVSYPVADTTKWSNRLQQVISHGSDCH